VIFAFSSGSCLIAHSRLAQSMPELVNDRNCLLADTPEGIADLITKAVTDSKLRDRIGAAAREIYLSQYQPGMIARGLLAMVS
jgi:glycosyltransferase involved in cell wall biosynthesis